MMKKHLDNILAFQKERDWKRFHTPKNLAISLSLEASEILELFQWTENNEKITHKYLDLIKHARYTLFRSTLPRAARPQPQWTGPEVPL